ncbi:MAG TPA: hypothetical protein VJ527_14470 [Rhodanobacter sp.]|nr:hypothetical protein [Rhodanobacter sp.]
MNEFEWRRQLRDLRQPLAPRRDLWTSIDALLEDAERTQEPVPPHSHEPRRRRLLAAVGLAASLLLAAGIGWRAWQHPTAAPATERLQAGAHWKPADPRFAGAAIELDAARMELQLALQQAPDSPALQRLLGRTEQQQTQLRQLGRQAG